MSSRSSTSVRLYDSGHGVAQDYAEAARWYRKAADQGDVAAQFNVGVMYERGQGVPQDYAEAARWYRKAADQGYAAAQGNLGNLYAHGQGVIAGLRGGRALVQQSGRSGKCGRPV